MYRKLLLSVVAAITLLIGCDLGTSHPQSSNKPADLTGTWVLYQKISYYKVYDLAETDTQTYPLSSDEYRTSTFYRFLADSTVLKCQNGPGAQWKADTGRFKVEADSLILIWDTVYADHEIIKKQIILPTHSLLPDCGLWNA